MNVNSSMGSKFSGKQLFYTSCEHGLSGSRGFQLHRISEGINPETQAGILKIMHYNRPNSYPKVPNSEVTLDEYPVAFRSVLFDSNHLFISRSVYVGLDYSGRTNNFFSHGIILNGLPKNTWPVDYYEWNGWKDALSPDEDSPTIQKQLPSVYFTPDTEALCFAELQEFLREEDGRQTHLANMIRAVLLRKKTDRNIIIKDEFQHTGIFWIASIQKSFSPSHQRDISCSTYEFDPVKCLSVNITQDETDILLGENERQYQFYVFDFKNDLFSEIESDSDDYASIISGWMEKDPEKLAGFHDFSFLFDHEELDDNITTTLNLYRLKIGEEVSFQETDLIRILEFINQHTKKNAFEKILEIVSSTIKYFEKSNDLNCMGLLARFFHSCANATQNEIYRETVRDLMLRILDRIIFTETKSIDKFDTLRAELNESYKKFEYEFAVGFLSENHLSILFSKISSMTDEVLQLIIGEIVSSIRIISPYQGTSLAENEIIKRFVENIIKIKSPELNRIDWLFSFFIDDISQLSSIFIYISNILSNSEMRPVSNKSFENLACFLFELSSKKGNSFRLNFLNDLKSDNSTWPLLKLEWRYDINNTNNKIQAHEEYQKYILGDRSDFAKNYIASLAEELWNTLSYQERQIQAVRWIVGGNTQDFYPNFVERLFETAINRVSFDPDDNDSIELLNLISDSINRCKLPIKKERLILRNAAIRASNRSSLEEQPIDKVFSILNNSEMQLYNEFIPVYLPLILEIPISYKQHGKILKYTFLKTHYRTYSDAYRRFFQKRPANSFGPESKSALLFWLFLKNNDDEFSELTFMRDDAFTYIVAHISSLKDSTYAKFLKTMDNNPDIKHDAKRKWTMLKKRIEERRNTFLRKVWRKASTSTLNFSKVWRKKNG